MNIVLREVSTSDLPLIMAWRSNPTIYKGFYQQKGPLVWESHVAWFASRNSDWRAFLVCLNLRPIGVVNLGQLDHWSPEIGYFIGEVSLWGQGIGTEAVRLGIEWLKGYRLSHPHIIGVHTTIKNDNDGSIGIVKRLGFKKGMLARDGEHYYYREL